MPYDLVSLGEALLRLAPPPYVQLRRTSSLDVVVVGSQLNVAANMARLGNSAAFLTRFPDSPLGQLALDAGLSYGLDMSHVQLLPGSRMGTTYVEFSTAPRAPQAIYDRQHSAASTIGPDTFAWEQILDGSHYAHTDGIFPGLSATCRAATRKFLQTAREQGCVTCFDINYREHLWTPETARLMCQELLPLVDILVTNRGFSESVLEFSGDDQEMARAYADQWGCGLVCLTSRETLGLHRGAWSSCAWNGGDFLRGERHEFDIIDRYGTGDAWVSGLLHGYQTRDLSYALDFGNALCALAHTIHGDIAHVSPEQVEALMGGDIDLRVRR
jgi:2-dehydro-3-deoxygluconokinase